jgi:hypothetical protein
MQIGTIETSPQLLNKDQVNSILDILEKDYITPLIKSKYKEIEESEEYKSNLNLIQEAKTNFNKIYTKIFNNDRNYFSDTDLINNIYNSLGYESSSYGISRNIKNDLRARLQLIQVDNFDIIIENIVKYIDIDKYIKNTSNNNSKSIAEECDCCEN